MARQYGWRSSPVRYVDDRGDGADQHRHTVGRSSGGRAMLGGGDSKAAAQRWTELQARIRVARALRYRSQNRLLPARHSTYNSDICRTSSPVNRLEPITNNQTTLRTGRQSEVMSTEQHTRRSRHTTTAWRKCRRDEEDWNNRNDPDSIDMKRAAPVNRQLKSTLIGSSRDHVIDNFRFIDVERKWTRNEARYVDENITTCFQDYGRVKSLENDNDVNCFNNSTNRIASVNVDCKTSDCSEVMVRTSDVDQLRCSDVQRVSSSKLKRSRLHWSSDPLFTGRSIDQQCAIDELLSLDIDVSQAMDVDSDDEQRQTVHHGNNNDDDDTFLGISRELQKLYLSDDDPKTTADTKLTTCPLFSTTRLPVIMLSTVENETCGQNHSTGNSKVAVQRLTDNTRCIYPDNSRHDTSTNAIGGTAETYRNNRYCDSVSVSHPESVFRQDFDEHRPELNEVSGSALQLASCDVNSLPPSNELTHTTATANLRLLQFEVTSYVVSLILYKCKKCSLAYRH